MQYFNIGIIFYWYAYVYRNLLVVYYCYLTEVNAFSWANFIAVTTTAPGGSFATSSFAASILSTAIGS